MNLLSAVTPARATPTAPAAFPSITSVSYGDLAAYTSINLYFDNVANTYDQNTLTHLWEIDYSLDTGTTWVKPGDNDYGLMQCYFWNSPSTSRVCAFHGLPDGSYSVALRYNNVSEMDPNFQFGTQSEAIPFQSVSYLPAEVLMTDVEIEGMDQAVKVTFTPPAVTQYVNFRNINFTYSLLGGDSQANPQSWHYQPSELKQVTSQQRQTWIISGLQNFASPNYYLAFSYYIPGDNEYFGFASYDFNAITHYGYLAVAGAMQSPTIRHLDLVTFDSFAIDYETPTTNAQIYGYKYSTDNGATWSNAGLSLPLIISTQSDAAALTSSTSYEVRLRAIYRDNNGEYDGYSSESMTITMPSPLRIASPVPGAIFRGLLGESFTAGIVASGGTAPYVYNLSSGSLPPGVSFETSTGTFQGFPNQVGSFAETVTVTDALGDSEVISISLIIHHGSSEYLYISYPNFVAPVDVQRIADVEISIAVDLCGCSFNLTFQITSESGDFALANDGCWDEYGFNQTCNLTIAFTPTRTGVQYATISSTLFKTGGNVTQNLIIRASGPPVQNSAPSTSVPDPLQQSKILSISPSEADVASSPSVTINGQFVENIVEVIVDGTALTPGSWKQTNSQVTFTMPTKPIGTYVIQLYNGAFPLLDSVRFTYRAALAKPVAVPTPTSTPEITTPEVTKSVDVVSETKMPLLTTIKRKIFFDMGSAIVYKGNLVTLKKLAALIAGLGEKITINVTGYAQPTPKGASLDAALSKRRAAAVTKILMELGVSTKVVYKGAGRTAKNVPSSRYVEIVADNR